MKLATIALSILLTILSTIIMSYVSIATMFGPWLAPTIVLLTSIILRLFWPKKPTHKLKQELIFTQAVASGGGTIAVGIGFSLPILYFLNRSIFQAYMAQPLKFCGFLALICLAAGTFGIVLARAFSHKLFNEERLRSPVSQLTFNVANAQSQNQQALKLFAGIIFSGIILLLRDGFIWFQGIIPKKIPILPSLLGKEFGLSIWPTLWAIGFTTGMRVSIPLIIGIISKYLIIYPLNYHSQYLSICVFRPLELVPFATAFCSGLVIAEIVMGFLKKPKSVWTNLSTYYMSFMTLLRSSGKKKQKSPLQALELIFALVLSIILLTYLQFSILEQAMLIFATVIATYEISYIGCEIGLVQFGRFSSFVLIPMLIMFPLNDIKITVICIFFNICAATATDYLFDIKTSKLSKSNPFNIHIAQWIGLIVTSLGIGIILYFLFTYLELGSEHLFAYRGKTKAILIRTLNLDPKVVSLGLIYGMVLKKLRISPTMTLGGILMPNHLTLGIVMGALTSKLVKQKESYMPFCAGMFAYESLWIMITCTIKAIGY